jgi:hypothetical protein
MINDPQKDTTPVPESSYDPPQVEQVIGADELAREVHYAGAVDPSRIAG